MFRYKNFENSIYKVFLTLLETCPSFSYWLKNINTQLEENYDIKFDDIVNWLYTKTDEDGNKKWVGARLYKRHEPCKVLPLKDKFIISSGNSDSEISTVYTPRLYPNSICIKHYVAYDPLCIFSIEDVLFALKYNPKKVIKLLKKVIQTEASNA